MKPLRILIVTANFAPHVGGIERFVETLSDGLAARGHEVTVICCRSAGAPVHEQIGLRDRSDPFLLCARTTTWRARIRSRRRRLVRTLGRLLRHADVVHVQDAIYATSVASLIAARRQARSERAHPARCLRAAGESGARRGRTCRARDDRACSAARHHRRDAESSRRRLGRRRRGGSRSRAFFPVGVPEPPGRGADREAVRRSFGLPEDRFVALFIGRDVPKKGLDVFLAAGDPAYELVAVTDRIGSRPGARFLPFMPRRSARRAAPRGRRLRASLGGRGVPADVAGGLRHRAPRRHDDAARIRRTISMRPTSS